MTVKREADKKKNAVYHGPRFDVYAEDEHGTIYDLEMQNQNHHDIEKRMAIYQGNLEKQALYAGQSFSERRQTVVLFLCDHDIYNLNRVHYQLIPQLVGYPEILIDNGETNVIVNLKGDASKQAALNQEMLTYFNDGTVTGKFSAALDRAVREVKNDVKKGENYMTIEEYAARQSAYAREEERAEKEAQTIKGLVTLNLDKDQIIKFLIDNFNLNKQEALAAYERVMATA
ncbi:PD-(D/E)XK nuclease family transposase [Ligilactobacillus agilis]|uniref:PD-(D/E)XK nuclease family transposase n=1 Tax=Ligilactobacillus agilis TaxID=1601 RepID=UPI0025A39C8F|nr:PD-(D/E)XK nuclease family transposase [Ligilactobacillus agilis]MDM8281003.1 PD-(D/E)XK nuclease family transposase [Ligilactobacillus agilis]